MISRYRLRSLGISVGYTTQSYPAKYTQPISTLAPNAYSRGLPLDSQTIPVVQRKRSSWWNVSDPVAGTLTFLCLNSRFPAEGNNWDNIVRSKAMVRKTNPIRVWHRLILDLQPAWMRYFSP